MTGTSLILDTSIVLYYLSGYDGLQELADLDIRYVSAITEIELLGYHKLNKSEETKIRKFLGSCVVIEMSMEVRTKGIHLRKKHKLSTPDSIIAASAQLLNISLITADLKLASIPDISILHYKIV